MRAIPFARWSLESARPAAEVSARLEQLVEPRKLLRLGKGERPFQGEVNPERFQISRIITYRNAFLPQIIGQVVPTPQGSRLTAMLRLNLVTLAILSTWFIFLAFIGVGVWLVRGPTDPGAWGPLAIFAVGYFITLAAFWFEAKRARELLDGVVR